MLTSKKKNTPNKNGACLIHVYCIDFQGTRSDRKAQRGGAAAAAAEAALHFRQRRVQVQDMAAAAVVVAGEVLLPRLPAAANSKAWWMRCLGATSHRYEASGQLRSAVSTSKESTHQCRCPKGLIRSTSLIGQGPHSHSTRAPSADPGRRRRLRSCRRKNGW